MAALSVVTLPEAPPTAAEWQVSARSTTRSASSVSLNAVWTSLIGIATSWRSWCRR